MMQGRPLDALYLFACYLLYLREQDEEALGELFDASTDRDPEVRLMAQSFLERSAKLSHMPEDVQMGRDL